MPMETLPRYVSVRRMPIPTRDFVELMTDQRIPFCWIRGRWIIGQVLYAQVGRKGQVIFRNRPY